MIDIVSLIQSRGISLTKKGSHYHGQCPFHEDSKTDSLSVDSKDNTFRCSNCDLVGNAKTFISKHDGISLTHAQDLIDNGGALVYQHKDSTPKKSTVSVLPCPISEKSEGAELLNEVVDYYHQHLLSHQAAIDYLTKRGVYNLGIIEKYKIGFADRSLGLRLPNSKRVAGKKIRSNLVSSGIYRSTGHAHFNGCVVIPVCNTRGKIENIYGRRIDARSPKIKKHLTLNKFSIFNVEALESRQIILCDTIINTLSYLSNGLENALCIVGNDYLSDELIELIKARKIDSVSLAFPSDDHGEVATLNVAEKLKTIGISVSQIKFPWGWDANDLLMKKGIDELVESHRNSLWLGGGSIPDARVTEVITTLKKTREDSSTPEKTCPKTTPTKKVGDYYHIKLGDCDYRIGGLDKNNSMNVMKVTIRVSCEGLIHIDNVDLYKDSDRRKFIDRANEEVLLDKALVKRDLGKILMLLEQEMEQRIYHSEVESKPTIAISDKDRKEALEFLQSPNLLEKTLSAFDEIGLVGEATNKMTAFFAMVSRLLTKPLAIVIQSSSASGKSALMDGVLSFFPPSQQLVLSSLTGQALYYQKSLQHKILGISEDIGFERAGESLKLLQSQGYLSLSTSRNVNGKMVSEEYHVEGPIALIFTSTSCDLSEELINRCIVLNLVEDESVTQQIHRQQREARTLNGLLKKENKKKIQHTMQVAQLLLKQYQVINPFAPKLTFTSTRSRTRRDHEKYLNLIDSIALYRQHQKTVKVVTVPSGEEIEYIEVELKDIEYANKLAPEIFGKTLDELPPQTRRLLDVCRELMSDKLESNKSLDHGLTRREIREKIGWSEYQVRSHIKRLELMEYIIRKAGKQGQTCKYELLVGIDDDRDLWNVGLMNVDSLKHPQSISTTQLRAPDLVT